VKPILKHTAALAALLTLSFSAAAHRVNLFAWSEGNAVQVESKFSDSTPVKGGKLTVTDTATGKVLASGKTSDTGTWRFTLPAGYRSEKGVTVAVAAGEGHAATWEMTPSDLPKTVTAAPAPKSEPAAKPAVKSEPKAEAKPAATKAPVKAEAKAPVKAAAPAAKPTAQQVENATVPVEPGLTKDEITLIAQSAVEEKVAPLRQKIAELSNPNPSAKDVIGGLGWIFGIAGAAALGYKKGKEKGEAEGNKKDNAA
jgi:nickel transport protein